MTNSFQSTSVQSESTKYTLEELLSIFLGEELPLSSEQIEILESQHDFSEAWSEHYDGKDTLKADINTAVNGNGENDFLEGSYGNEALDGKGGNDFIWGGDGDDQLFNESGKDILIGGPGNDKYLVTSLDTIIVESSDNGGNDTVFVIPGESDYSIPNNVETLVIQNPITSPTSKSWFTGSDEDDVLSIEISANANIGLRGGLLDDTYRLSSLGSNILIEEDAGILSGDDWIYFDPTKDQEKIDEYTLPANIENIQISDLAEEMTLIGNEDDNSILGNSSSNSLFGGDGKDYLHGGGGANNHLEGGLHDDTYEITSNNSTIVEKSELYSGDDWIIVNFSGSEQNPEIYKIEENVENLELNELSTYVYIEGSQQDNIIIGNSHNNVLFGLDGDDYLDGKGGGNYLVGGYFNDTYKITSGNDIIIEDNELFSGNDWIVANFSDSDQALDNGYIIPNNVENIQLEETSANITINGNESNNIMTGNEGNNVLLGNDGDDYLNGVNGTNHLVGGLHDDTYEIASANNTIIETDELYSGDDWIIVNFSASEQNPSEYRIVENVENLQLKETSENINIIGNQGNNIIIGNSDNNIIIGGEGKDILEGKDGSNHLEGGLHDDTYEIASANNTIIETDELYSGDDWIIVNFSASEQNPSEYRIVENVENLQLKETSENINIIGNQGNNIIIGNSDNNIIIGGEGKDILEGKDGSNHLEGGLHDDTYIVSNLQTSIYETSKKHSGEDWVRIDLSDELTDDESKYILADNIENIMLEETSQNIGIIGNILDNTIKGNTQNNLLQGGGGRDDIKGGEGKDYLDGGEGNDYLYGGKGHDRMYGGSGVDVFIVNPNDYGIEDTSPDIIEDFNSKEDFIQINTSYQSTTNREILSSEDFAITRTSSQLNSEHGLQSSAEYVFDESQGVLYHNDNGEKPGVDYNQNGILDLGANTILTHENIITGNTSIATQYAVD